jgi:hypothetical protein
MPIYEYYCPDNHTIYQFFAKTLAQGASIPACPDNPVFRMEKLISAFAITGRHAQESQASPLGGAGEDPSDARMEAAMGDLESEFSSIDENDPRAMGRMMRRIAELSGERIDGEIEEVVRKLEEGTDPEKLEEQFGGEESGPGDDPYGDNRPSPEKPADPKEPRHRYRQRRRQPFRDPKLYDY